MCESLLKNLQFFIVWYVTLFSFVDGKNIRRTCCLCLWVGGDYCTVLKMVAVTSSEKMVYQFTLSSALSVCPSFSLLSFLCLYLPKLFSLSFFLSFFGLTNVTVIMG